MRCSAVFGDTYTRVHSYRRKALQTRLVLSLYQKASDVNKKTVVCYLVMLTHIYTDIYSQEMFTNLS